MFALPSQFAFGGKTYRIGGYTADFGLAHYITFHGEVSGEVRISEKALLLAGNREKAVDLVYGRLEAAIGKAIEAKRIAELQRPAKRAMASRARRRRAASKASSL